MPDSSKYNYVWTASVELVELHGTTFFYFPLRHASHCITFPPEIFADPDVAGWAEICAGELRNTKWTAIVGSYATNSEAKRMKLFMVHVFG